MSNHNNNRFLLPQQQAGGGQQSTSTLSTKQQQSQEFPDENQLSVDTDFDSYWEEEARNPHRNRIRIGRQYQASVPAVLKQGEKDTRKLKDLETLTFCPKKSAKLSDSELDHYFTVAKSLNLFANLVETRSLLGRDVTIADLNHIRHKEGLSLASVIQPLTSRQSNTSNASPSSSQQQQLPTTSISSSIAATTSLSATTPLKPTLDQTTNCDTTKQADASATTATSSPDEANQRAVADNFTLNQPLMRALSHFINLHHPCHHDNECKKLLKDEPQEDESNSTSASTLRPGTSSVTQASNLKVGRSRSSMKQLKEEFDQQQEDGENNSLGPSFGDWTREEVELFSKAIEICGKNFSSIKKDFLPSKSVKSIVEYYYIGSRDTSENKKKPSHPIDASDGCSNIEKMLANNNGQGGGNGGHSSSSTGGRGGTYQRATSGPSSTAEASSSTSTTASSSSFNQSNNDANNKSLSNHQDEIESMTSTKQNRTSSKASKQSKVSLQELNDFNGTPMNKSKITTRNIDARMSVYNFDEEMKEDNPMDIESPKPGSEVKPLKAKPIMPSATMNSEPTNSDMGSLKFFMDGQLVLKLNACQDSQEGKDKCHWVQSGDKVVPANRQKRYSKRPTSDKSAVDSYQNGSHSNSVISSYQDDDSKNEDLTNDEDSKESANSFTNLANQQQQQQTPQPSVQKTQQPGPQHSKRSKVKIEPSNQQLQHRKSQISPSIPHQQQFPSPINYNRAAINNRMKDRNEITMNPGNSNFQGPGIGQGLPPWLQANHFAVAAALLSGLPFPPNAGNSLIDSNLSQSSNAAASSANFNSNSMNLTSKPMDLSLEHTPPHFLNPQAKKSKK